VLRFGCGRHAREENQNCRNQAAVESHYDELFE
jgi:hypothetical protein